MSPSPARSEEAASSEAPRVLVVEDDQDVRVTTGLVLRRHGFEVMLADGGRTALEMLVEPLPDVVVLDVAMPDIDGIRVTRLIRERHDLPILLLTARDLPSDMVVGLDAGADDYVTKPFDGEVLAARIRALLRRRARPAVERVGELEVDRAGHVVRVRGTEVVLSSTEYRVLELFLDNPGQVISRSQALRRVWGDDEWVDERVVDTNIARLRTKLGVPMIETVRGFGYRLARP